MLAAGTPRRAEGQNVKIEAKRSLAAEPAVLLCPISRRRAEAPADKNQFGDGDRFYWALATLC